MVDIAPFRGLLFNQRKVGPTNQVTAPPYDVISPEQQEALYKKNPNNVVRLILEKQYQFAFLMIVCLLYCNQSHQIIFFLLLYGTIFSYIPPLKFQGGC